MTTSTSQNLWQWITVAKILNRPAVIPRRAELRRPSVRRSESIGCLARVVGSALAPRMKPAWACCSSNGKAWRSVVLRTAVGSLLGDVMKRTVVVVFALIACTQSYAGWFESATFDGCVLDKMPGVSNALAAKLVLASCVSFARANSGSGRGFSRSTLAGQIVLQIRGSLSATSWGPPTSLLLAISCMTGRNWTRPRLFRMSPGASKCDPTTKEEHGPCPHRGSEETSGNNRFA